MGLRTCWAGGYTRGVTINPGSKMPSPASLDDTALVPSRKPETDRGYEKGGQKLLDRAMRLYPDAGGPINAFIRLCDNTAAPVAYSNTSTRKNRAFTSAKSS